MPSGHVRPHGEGYRSSMRFNGHLPMVAGMRPVYFAPLVIHPQVEGQVQVPTSAGRRCQRGVRGRNTEIRDSNIGQVQSDVPNWFSNVRVDMNIGDGKPGAKKGIQGSLNCTRNFVDARLGRSNLKCWESISSMSASKQDPYNRTHRVNLLVFRISSVRRASDRPSLANNHVFVTCETYSTSSRGDLIDLFFRRRTMNSLRLGCRIVCNLRNLGSSQQILSLRAGMATNPFDKAEMGTPDPILGLSEAFQKVSPDTMHLIRIIGECLLIVHRFTALKDMNLLQ